jgi:hypothetical protein
LASLVRWIGEGRVESDPLRENWLLDKLESLLRETKGGDARARICGSSDKGSDTVQALGRNFRDETDDFCLVWLGFVGDSAISGRTGANGLV